MSHIYRTRMTPKFATASLLAILMSASLLTAGCGKTAKKNPQASISTPTIKQLSEPSYAYLSDTAVTDQRSSEAWMVIANKDYDAKRYARALRAANEALSIDNEKVDARQIAMLSAVKVMGNNIDAYSDDAMMNSGDKATFKETLTNITTLINASK